MENKTKQNIREGLIDGLIGGLFKMRREDKDREVWVKGHYRKTKYKGENGKIIRKWVEGYWKNIKLPKIKRSPTYRKRIWR